MPHDPVHSSGTPAGSTLEQKTFRDRRRTVAEAGLRIGARVSTGCLLTYAAITLAFRPMGGAGFRSLFLGATILLILWALWLSFRPVRRNRPWRTTWTTASLFTLAIALLLSGVSVLTGSLVGPESLAMVILLVGYAVLLPSPLAAGVPVLAACTLSYPTVIIGSGLVGVGDVQLASNLVTIATGFSFALVLMWVNQSIYQSRARVLASMEQTAAHDHLTGALNRRALAEALQREHERCGRYGGALGVLFVDVDRFKRFNQNHGYAAGDEALRSVADAIHTVARAFHPRAAVGRFGGEEFVVLLPDASESATSEAAEQLRTAVEALRVPWKRSTLHTTVSIGTAHLGHEDKTPLGVLLHAADGALYRAKTTGGNRVVEADDLAHMPVDDTLARMMQPLEQARRAPGPQREATTGHLRSLHRAVLRWLLLLCGVWLVLFGLLDVGLAMATADSLLLERVLPVRLVLAALALGLVVWFPKLPAHPSLALGLHTGLMGTLALFGIHAANVHGVEGSPYLATTVYALVSWSLAMGVRPLVSAAILAAVGLGSPLVWIIVTDSSWMPLLVDGGVHSLAALVAFAVQQRLSSLRAEEYRMREELHSQARFDPLTGVRNRTGLLERLDDEIVAARSRSGVLSLAVLDLDRFKALNDAHGHLRGDQALQRLANAFGDVIRGVDTPGRLGGEEFAIVLPHTGADDAIEAVERLRRHLESLPVPATDRTLTASFGIATLLADDDAATLLARADDALRVAKSTGRNRVVHARDLPAR